VKCKSILHFLQQPKRTQNLQILDSRLQRSINAFCSLNHLNCVRQDYIFNKRKLLNLPHEQTLTDDKKHQITILKGRSCVDLKGNV